MKSTVDYKMAFYVFLVGCASVGVRSLTSPELPFLLGIVVGIGLCIFSAGLSFLEIRGNRAFFYGFAENWNGYGIVNSGFITGMSAFFFSKEWRQGIAVAVFLSLCTILERKGIRALLFLSRRKGVQSEKRGSNG